MFLLWLLAGFGALVVLLGLMRLFVSADPRRLARGLRVAGAILLGVAAIPLFLAGRILPALLLAAGGLWLVGRLPAGAFRLFGLPFPGSGSRSGPQPGQVSTIESVFLRMRLDHDTGELSGTVVAGLFRGRALHELDRGDVLRLLAELRVSDERGAALLETWADRNLGPDWRRDPEAEREAPGAAPPPPGAMPLTEAEALAALGLGPGADAEAIREAHRRLMREAHPDAGGSAAAAARLNAARDFLLKARRRA